MTDCVFCAIVAGTVPSTEVHSSPAVYAFADREPAAPVHVLIVPRRHITNAAEIGPEDGDLLAEMLLAASEVARRQGIAESGYRLVFNVGDDASNTVPHLHLHVIGGRPMAWPPG